MRGNEANARTDERGHRLVGQYPGNMKTVPLVEHRKNPWTTSIAFRRSAVLGDLLGANSKYHLIARYLIDEKGFLATQKCNYGLAGIIRSIKIGDKEYRSNAYSLYERKAFIDEDL